MSGVPGGQSDEALLARIEAYYDEAPRLGATVEHHGPLTLFVPRRGSFPFYARPRRGEGHGPIAAIDVRAVRARQRALELPEELEWVDELDPSVGPACEATGLVVTHHPLLVLGDEHAIRDDARPAITGDTVAIVDLDDRSPDDLLRAALMVPAAAFAHPGTAVGEPVELADPPPGLSVDTLRSRLVAGNLTCVLAVEAGRPVGVASTVVAGGVAEVVGVGTVPDRRHRGIGALTTAAVVERARARAADVVFLSAADDDVARLYERLGFRRIANAGTAAPPATS